MGARIRHGCIGVVIGAVLVLVACSGGGGSSNANNPDQQNQANNPGQQQNQQQQEPQQATKVKIAVNGYASCHDATQKKSTGPSDGLWDIGATGAPDGSIVTITFKSSIGNKTVEGQGKVTGGQVTIRIPLQSFGEVLEVTDVKVVDASGTEIDADFSGLPKETVDPTSDCTDEADATNDQVTAGANN